MNIYRSFNTIGMSARDGFVKQLNLIKAAMNGNPIIMGDFNIDYR